jgi:hypothetical protein
MLTQVNRQHYTLLNANPIVDFNTRRTANQRSKESKRRGGERERQTVLLLPSSSSSLPRPTSSRLRRLRDFPSSSEFLHFFRFLAGFAQGVLDGVFGGVEVEGDFFVVELDINVNKRWGWS